MALDLDKQIESILFFKGEEVSVKKLAQILDSTPSKIEEAIEILEESLENRGIKLLTNGDKVSLVTNPEMSDIIESLNKEELTKDLSKAALETLSIILYRGPIRRSEIDYIRGVNSQFILRTLAIRGLIDKKQDPKNDRSYVYSASTELLQFLGVSKKEDLPEYQNTLEAVEKFEQQKEDEGKDQEE